MLNLDAEDLKPFLMVGLRVWGPLVVTERLGGGVVVADVDDTLVEVTGMWVARVRGAGNVSVSRTEEGESSLELTGAAKVPVGSRSMAAATSSSVALRPRKSTMSIVPYSLSLMGSSFRYVGSADAS